MSLEVKLYSKVDCPLCDQAHQALKELKDDLDLSIEIIDIYKSDELIEQYGLMIPVVAVGDKEIDSGYISREIIRDKLEACK